MLRLQRLALWLTLITIILGGFFRPLAAGRPAEAAVGYPAPDFTLNDLQGRPVQLSKVNYFKPILLNFWATWCPPCQAEMPELQRLKAAHPDLLILGVNLGESPEQVSAYMAKHGYDWPVLIDDGRVSDTYQAISIPTSYFITPEGVVSAIYRGPMSLGLMEELIFDPGGYTIPEGGAWPTWLTGGLLPAGVRVGPLTLPVGPLLAMVAIFAADWLVRRQRRHGAERALGWLVGGALLGAKLGEILRSPSSFLAFPRLLIAAPAGLWAVLGAAVGAGVALWWALRSLPQSDRQEAIDSLGLPLLVGLAIMGLGSGQAALIQAGGWLVGAFLLWPKREEPGAWLFALAWAIAVWVSADITRPLAISEALSTKQVLGALVVGFCDRLATARATGRWV